MKTTIQSLHFTPSEALNSFIREKAGRLAHLHDRIEACDVYLKIEHSSTDENKIAEVKLLVPGHNLFARRQSAVFETAVDDALDAIRKQLEKLKTKLENQ
jgi:putative sigma-54 modulation protein